MTHTGAPAVVRGMRSETAQTIGWRTGGVKGRRWATASMSSGVPMREGKLVRCGRRESLTSEVQCFAFFRRSGSLGRRGGHRTVLLQRRAVPRAVRQQVRRHRSSVHRVPGPLRYRQSAAGVVRGSTLHQRGARHLEGSRRPGTGPVARGLLREVVRGRRRCRGCARRPCRGPATARRRARTRTGSVAAASLYRAHMAPLLGDIRTWCGLAGVGSRRRWGKLRALATRRW